MSKYDLIDFSKIFDYDATSPSCLRWKIQPAYHVKVGDVAGSITHSKKAWDVLYKRKHYLVHRIVWYLFYGEIDDTLVVNHINCNPLDNRVSNLELCSIKENNQRTSLMLYGNLSSGNSTGVNGVQRMKCFNKNKTLEYDYYVGCVTVNNKLHRKLFSISKLGEDEALLLAKNWRETKIQELVKNGYISLSSDDTKDTLLAYAEGSIKSVVDQNR